MSCSAGCLPYQSRFLLGHCFGVYPTPGGRSLFCFGFAALRVTVSICDGPSVNAELGLGSRAHSLGFARCDPSKIGNSKTETQSCTRTKQSSWASSAAMRKFAPARTTRSSPRSPSPPRPPTRDKESGEYISHTEWHRCIVFGKFGEFAATLKKGAHVQVEGEIRHTEYTPKKAKKPVRSDSVRVTSILKLDRAEKAAAEEEFDEIPAEEEAE